MEKRLHVIVARRGVIEFCRSCGVMWVGRKAI
jgi:hypothetical protein